MNETSKADVFLWWWSLDGKCWLCSRGERAAKDLWASPEPKWRKWHWDLKLSLTLLVSKPLNKSSIKTWVVMTTCIPFSLWRARAEDWRGISAVWLKLLKPAEHSGASVENHFIKQSPTDRLHGPEMLELKWHNKCLFRARSSLLDRNIYTVPGIYSQSRNQTLAHRAIINVFDTKKILRLWFFFNNIDLIWKS